MEKTFQTGSFSFRLKFPEELVLPADMEKFSVETDSADYTYIITAVDILPEAEGELIVDRVDLQVFHTKEGLESRRIGVKGEARPYAFYRETAQNRAEVFVGRWYLAEVEKYEVVFLSLLALAPSGGAAVPDSALCIHGVSGESNALFCTIGNGQNHAGGTVGTVSGKPYRKWG